MKESLLSFSLEKIKNLIVEEFNEKPFRAGQIFTRLHLGEDFLEMTALSNSLREKLNERYSAVPVKIIKSLKSARKSFYFCLKTATSLRAY